MHSLSWKRVRRYWVFSRTLLKILVVSLRVGWTWAVMAREVRRM